MCSNDFIVQKVYFSLLMRVNVGLIMLAACTLVQASLLLIGQQGSGDFSLKKWPRPLSRPKTNHTWSSKAKSISWDSPFKCFRERTDELMSQLNKHDIPVLILSAGLGDLIHEVLQQFKVIFSLNYFFVDDTGTVVYTRYEWFGKLAVPSDSSLPSSYIRQ